MSNAGGMATVTRYTDMLAGNNTWNPWEPQGAYDALATVVVPSGGVASINFAGIPTGYKHLQLRVLARNTNASDYGAGVRFNSDSSGSYVQYHQVYSDGGGVGVGTGATSANNMEWLYMPGTNRASNIYGSYIIDILDYASTTKNKTIRNIGGFDANGAGYAIIRSHLWVNTSAVTSINLFLGSGNFTQHSQFALYGVK